VQSKLDWLEVFTVALVAIGVIGVMTGHVNPGYPFEKILLSLGGPLVLAFTAWALKPWRKKNVSAEGKLDRHAWILIAVAIACVTAWLAGLAQLWTAR
jgi:putative Ca2+/H+ antiporter (TMEM165/GDT1 family)